MTITAVPEGLRRVTDADSAALIALVDAIYGEHPGCVLDLEGVDQDLLAPASTAASQCTASWVVERDGQVIATIAAGSVRDGTVELKRLYVDAAHRRRGLATSLIQVVEGQAAGLGATAVELWSDTRFLDAHRRYEALGFRRTGEERHLYDPSDTTEYHFVLEVTPRPVTSSISWDGPFGHEIATVVDLPAGWLLASFVADGAVVSRIEVDELWQTRTVTVAEAGSEPRAISHDGAGQWWLDGKFGFGLEGATDVDIEVTPLCNTLPIRRLQSQGIDDAEVLASWVRIPGGAVEPLVQRYTQLGPGMWRYRAGEFTADLQVDADGLVITYGNLWTRTPVAS